MSFSKSSKPGAAHHAPGALASTGLTPETQRLLEESMQKRGLSLRAMQDVAHSVQGGGNGWVDALVTRTATYTPPSSKTNPLSKNVPTYKKAGFKGPCVPTAPGSFSGKRMAVQIPAPGREQYIGAAPPVDREVLKDKLAHVMEFGSAAALRKHEAAVAAAQEAAEAAAARARPADVREAMIDQLVQEVSERTEFLESMRAAGRHQDYEAQLKGEINLRLVQLKGLGVDSGAGAPQQRHGRVEAPWHRKQAPGKRI